MRWHPNLVRRIVARDLVLFVTPVVLTRLLATYPLSAFTCRFYLVDNIDMRALEPARTSAMLRADERLAGSVAFFGDEGGLGYSFDIDKGTVQGGTVAYFALQVTTWLGFSKIYLHGVDLKDAAKTPRFYETEGQRAPTALDIEFDDLIGPSFRQAAAVLRARGIRVENLSLNSALGENVFPKVDWRSLCSGKPD